MAEYLSTDPNAGTRITANGRPFDEKGFRGWYARYSKQLGLDPDPDAPEHFYDYRGAFLSGATPDKSGHWPSEFKREGHPRLVLDGVDTRTGARVGQTKYLSTDPNAGEPLPKPQGLNAALAGAESISATPWHSQGMFGGRGPSVRDALDTLPAVGGIVGGVLGAPSGPGAVAASALGGGAGEAFKQLAERAIGVKAPASGTEAAADIATQAALQGAGEGVGRLMPVAGKALRNAAEVQYGRALNATTKPLKAESQRIVPELLDRRVHGGLSGLAERGAEASSEAGRRLGRAYEKASDAGVKSRTAPIIADLEKAKQRFFARSDTGERISANPGAVAKLEAMQELVGKFGAEVRPDQLWALRKNLDDIIRAAGGFGVELTPGTTKALQREGRAAIQRELGKASPDIAKINAEYSLWKGLENVAKATVERKTGQSGIVEIGLRSGVGGMAGLLVGRDDPTWGSVGALLAVATKSPHYRTFSALQKARLADALMTGQAQKAASILTKLLGSQATAQPHDGPTSSRHGSPKP